LGITVTAGQFENMDHWEPVFRQRLREWGLNSGEPIATAIVAESDADVAKIVAAHPDTDFYLPARFRTGLAEAARSTHGLAVVSDQRFFLLAKQNPKASSPPAITHIPRNW
jgi:hypothetical protein